VTVLGTGFLRQLLPCNDVAAPKALQHLISWPSLLKEIASRNSLLDVFDADLAGAFPTLQWDELVRGYVARCDISGAAYRKEGELKKVAVDVLAQAMAHANEHLDNAKLAAFLAVAGQHIVSLNFDTMVLGDKFAGQPVFDNKRPGVQHVKHSGKTFWFPHGCISNPDSIRLGLRDYGFLPDEWSTLFGEFKGFERSLLPNIKQVINNQEAERIKNELRLDTVVPQHQLLGHLMLAPLIFFGTGLSVSEWGLWWLLNQRARNLARIPLRDRPPAVIVIDRQGDRLPFWCTRPAGINPILVNNWDKGWSVLLEWLEQQRTS